MALSISNVFSCPKLRFSHSKPSISHSQSSFIRGVPLGGRSVSVVASTSAAGNSSPDSDINPYEVLGVNPFTGFDKVKEAYTKKQKEAERTGNEATLSRLEKAYDKLMMAQLSNRKMGVTYGLKGH